MSRVNPRMIKLGNRKYKDAVFSGGQDNGLFTAEKNNAINWELSASNDSFKTNVKLNETASNWTILYALAPQFQRTYNDFFDFKSSWSIKVSQVALQKVKCIALMNRKAKYV